MKRKFLGLALLSALSLGSIVGMTSCGEDLSDVPDPDDPNGDNSDKVEVTWSGLDDIETYLFEEEPDLLAGVSATTEDGKSLTVKVNEEQSDVINMEKTGAYYIYYDAYDGDELVNSDDAHADRMVIVNQGTYVSNGTFDNSIATWSANGNAGSQVSASYDEEQQCMVLNVANSGNEYWQNQAETRGIQVEKGVTYKVSFRAKSDTGHTVGATMEDVGAGYKVIESGNPNSVGYATTNEWQTYEFYYTSDVDCEDTKLAIMVGRWTEKDDAEAKIYIDDVKVEKMDKVANSTGVEFTGDHNVTVTSFDEYKNLAAVTAVDAAGNPVELVREGAQPTEAWPSDFTTAVFGEIWKYEDSDGNLSYFRRQITYKASIIRENEYDYLNADFNDNGAYWTFENGAAYAKDGQPLATISYSDSNATISARYTEKTDGSDWTVQLYQNVEGQVLREGHSYKVVMEAKIDNLSAGNLRIEFLAADRAAINNAEPKTDIIFSEANTFQTIESSVYTMTKDVNVTDSPRITLLLGQYSDDYTLTIDSLHIVEVNE